jgi:hypothetical protein
MKRGFPSVGLSDSKLLDIYSYMLYAMREDPGPAPAGACSAGSFQGRTSWSCSRPLDELLEG